MVVRNEKMDTEDFLRGMLGTPVICALVTDVVLRTLRNATLLRQGRKEYAQHQGLVERILSVPFDHSVAFGAATTAALAFHFAKKGEIAPYLSTNLGGLGVQWVIMSHLYMLAGSVLHPVSAKRMFHSTVASTAQLFGRHKSAVKHLEETVKLPMARRHRFRSSIELGEAHLWNRGVNEARTAFREAISTLRSDETSLSYFDLLFGPGRTFVEEYKKIAHSTNPVLTLRSFGDQKLILKLDKSDHEYRTNLLLEETFDYAHPLYVVHRMLPFSIMCKKGADGRFEHFMLRSGQKPLGTYIKHARVKNRYGGLFFMLGKLSELHVRVTKKLAEHHNRVPLPASDTEKVLEVPSLDYGAEFLTRAIAGEGKEGCYRLRRVYAPGENQALDDLIGSHGNEIIPVMERLPRMFIHHDVSSTNVLGKKRHHSFIDFGISRMGNPLIDVDHAFDMFGEGASDVDCFIESYANDYNETSDEQVETGLLGACYPYAALHNSLCSLGTSLQRGNMRSAQHFLRRARECLGVVNSLRLSRPFEAIVRSDERLKTLC